MIFLNKLINKCYLIDSFSFRKVDAINATTKNSSLNFKLYFQLTIFGIRLRFSITKECIEFINRNGNIHMQDATERNDM